MTDSVPVSVEYDALWAGIIVLVPLGVLKKQRRRAWGAVRVDKRVATRQFQAPCTYSPLAETPATFTTPSRLASTLQLPAAATENSGGA